MLNVQYNAINLLINAKYWSVGNRNKSIRGRFKILNDFKFIYIQYNTAI